MYISLNWIKDFVNLDGISVDELITRFGLSTAEVEGVEYKGQNISNIVVAEILSVENHPESKKLHILKVNDGTGAPVQVVCGAPNVRVGLKTAFARIGANVCGVKIGQARLAGIESFGMCCGENELGIGSDTSGIMELDSNLVNGTDIKKIFPIDDTIIEVDNKSLTNRPDLWGQYGMAREIATIFKRDLKPIEVEDLNQYNNLQKLDVKVESPDCLRYSSITIGNIEKKVSPMEMKIRLNYCGMRDISLIVDITNYLMLELGQPMHAFDNEKVKGVRVITTEKDTNMLTLEGGNHVVPSGSPLICDNNYTPVAIAGIKGGLLSGISENTNSLLLESATFSAPAIRKTSRKIGLITDASQRYEKSLSPEMTVEAIARVIYLLKQIDDKIVVTSRLTDDYKYVYPTLTIDTDAGFINKRGGVFISTSEMVDILTRLGFKVTQNNDNLSVVVPHYRATKDVSIKEDLVEEVLRMYGYDNIKSCPMQMPLVPVDQLSIHKFEYAIKKLLCDKYNCNEVHSYVWNYEDFNKQVGIEETSFVRLVDASNSGQSGIRSKLLPTMLKIFNENKNHFSNIRIFEIGRVINGLKDNLAVERRKLSIVLASTSTDNKTLYFEMKSIVEDIAKIANVSINYKTLDKSIDKVFHPINSCELVSNQKLGEMGVLHPIVAKNLDKKFNLIGLELDVEDLLSGEKKSSTRTKISKYQSTVLDFNFVLDENLPYSTITDAFKEFRCAYILEQSLKDIYVDPVALPNKKSYTISVKVTPKDRTLETSDLEKFSKRFLDHMKSFGIVLR